MWCFASSKEGGGSELGASLDMGRKFSVVSHQSSVKERKSRSLAPLGMTDRKSEERSPLQGEQEWLRYRADRIVDQVDESVKGGTNDQRGMGREEEKVGRLPLAVHR